MLQQQVWKTRRELEGSHLPTPVYRIWGKDDRVLSPLVGLNLDEPAQSFQ